MRRDHDLCHVNVIGEERRLIDNGEPGFGWGELFENNNMNVRFKRIGLDLRRWALSSRPPATTC